MREKCVEHRRGRAAKNYSYLDEVLMQKLWNEGGRPSWRGHSVNLRPPVSLHTNKYAKHFNTFAKTLSCRCTPSFYNFILGNDLYATQTLGTSLVSSLRFYTLTDFRKICEIASWRSFNVSYYLQHGSAYLFQNVQMLRKLDL